MRFWIQLLAMIALAVVGLGTAHAGTRVGLVVGVSDYTSGGRLVRTIADAEKIHASLTKVGFDLPPVLANPSRQELADALVSLSVKAGTADVAVVYFSGHGMQYNDDNWLLPVDAGLPTEESVEFQGVRLQSVVNAVARARLKIVILDACRNNPFSARWGRTKAPSEGLARVASEQLPVGTMVAFAAAAGQKTPDDGSYADALARWIPVEGLELRQVMDRVRRDVQGTQPTAAPSYEVHYEGSFSFTGSIIDSSNPLSDSLQRVFLLNSADELDAFASTNSDSLYAPIASDRARSIRELEYRKQLDGQPTTTVGAHLCFSRDQMRDESIADYQARIRAEQAMPNWIFSSIEAMLDSTKAIQDGPDTMTFTIETQGNHAVLVAAGNIDGAAQLRLAEILDRESGRLSEVWLNSPGGSSSAGVEMGRMIRRAGIDTRVRAGSGCAAACVSVLIGGVVRSVEPGAVVGVQMWQHASATGQTLDKDTLNKIVWDTGALVADRVAFANEMGLDGGAFVDVFGRVRGDCMTFMSQDQLLRTRLISFGPN